MPLRHDRVRLSSLSKPSKPLRRFDEDDQVIALDTFLCDLARLRIKALMLDPFLSDLKRYNDALQRDLARACDGHA